VPPPVLAVAEGSATDVVGCPVSAVVQAVKKEIVRKKIRVAHKIVFFN